MHVAEGDVKSSLYYAAARANLTPESDAKSGSSAWARECADAKLTPSELREGNAAKQIS
jgi:hypothetical protein